MTELRYEITINATAESVYAHLTEQAGLLRWMGPVRHVRTNGPTCAASIR